MVRLMLLERLLQTLPQLRNVGGVRAIPYMQVLAVHLGLSYYSWTILKHAHTSLPEAP